MPRLWTETIKTHRNAVRDAVLDTTGALVFERGLRKVTMSEIAERSGIGRATLYKYFPDVEAALGAWHERQIAQHFDQLVEVRDRSDDPWQRLEAVLEAYAHIARHKYGHHDSDLATFMHNDPEVGHAHQRLHDMIRDLLAEAADAGQVRSDVAPGELADYCVHALAAAGRLDSASAVDRLVGVILAGLRP